MNDPRNMFDDFARAFAQAGGMADGMRREIETFVKLQMKEFISAMNLVRREDYDSLLTIVQQQSDAIAKLEQRINTLSAGGSDAEDNAATASAPSSSLEHKPAGSSK